MVVDYGGKMKSKIYRTGFSIILFVLTLFIIIGTLTMSNTFVYALADEAIQESGANPTNPSLPTPTVSDGDIVVDIEAQIAVWKEYLDKYIMPNILAVMTSLGMVFAVFSRFKRILELYKTDRDKFKEEKDVEFKMMGSEIENLLEQMKVLKETTTDTISNMPISKIQRDIEISKESLIHEMNAIKTFGELFEIFMKSQRVLVDTSYLPTDEKLYLKKLFYEGEQMLEKKNLEVENHKTHVENLILDDGGVST